LESVAAAIVGKSPAEVIGERVRAAAAEMAAR
jgi:hypothetical protein